MDNNSILTATLPTGETVLAKKERVEDAFDDTAQYQESPLRYGNKTQAQKKLDSILPSLSPARSAEIVAHDGRFLVRIFDKPGYQTIIQEELTIIGHSGRELPLSQAIKAVSFQVKSLSDLVGARVTLKKGPVKAKSKPPFATTHGRRMNPRSRFNHPGNTSDESYYYVS